MRTKIIVTICALIGLTGAACSSGRHSPQASSASETPSRAMTATERYLQVARPLEPNQTDVDRTGAGNYLCGIVRAHDETPEYAVYLLRSYYVQSGLSLSDTSIRALARAAIMNLCPDRASVLPRIPPVGDISEPSVSTSPLPSIAPSNIPASVPSPTPSERSRLLSGLKALQLPAQLSDSQLVQRARVVCFYYRSIPSDPDTENLQLEYYADAQYRTKRLDLTVPQVRAVVTLVHETFCS